jgi:hypothetical protein
MAMFEALDVPAVENDGVVVDGWWIWLDNNGKQYQQRKQWQDITSSRNYSRLAIFMLLTGGHFATKGGGSDVGHKFENVRESEMVNWTAVLIRHGAYDGRASTINKRWDVKDPWYDPIIANLINKTLMDSNQTILQAEQQQC